MFFVLKLKCDDCSPVQVDNEEEFEKVLQEVKNNVAPLDAPVPPDPSEAVLASECHSQLMTL